MTVVNESQQQPDGAAGESLSNAAPPSGQTNPQGAGTNPNGIPEGYISREEFDKVNRQLISVRGNYDRERQRADKAAADLARAHDDYEKERSELVSKAAAAEPELARLRGESERERQLRVERERELELTDLMSDTENYPGLANMPPKTRKLARKELAALEGDARLAELKALSDEYANFGTQNRQERKLGSTPPAPTTNAQGGGGAQDYAEVRADMNRQMRENGPNSPEYRAAKALHDQYVKEGRHKSK